MERSEMLNVREAAAYLGLSWKALYDIIEKRKIRHYRLGASGGAIRLKRADLDDYLEDCLHPAVDGAEREALAEVRKSSRGRRSFSVKILADCLPSSRRT